MRSTSRRSTPRRRPTSRRLTCVAALLAVPLAACGGGSDSDDEVDDTTAVESAPTDTDGATFEPVDSAVDDADTATTASAPDTAADEAPAGTEAPATEEEAGPVDTAVAGDTAAEAGSEGASDEGVSSEAVAAADATLVEWAIEAPTEYVAGEVTFTAINGGGLPHELVVIAGEGYESLPTEEGGKVIEDELPTGALIGRTDRITAGESADLTVDLAPGNYVLICNLGGGPNSHAGRGQRLDITVG